MTTSVAPVPIPAGTAVPSRSGDQAAFDNDYEAFYGWEKDDLAPGMNALAEVTYANAQASESAALTAGSAAEAAEQAQAAAEAASSATKWVSGTTYAEGLVVWSPIDFASYRRKTTGGGTIDPSADSANWAALGSANGMVLLSTYNAAGASAVDIETGIGSTYDDYMILLSNVVMASTSQMRVRLKKSGSYQTGATYKSVYRQSAGSGTFYSSDGMGQLGLGSAGVSVISGSTLLFAANTAGASAIQSRWNYIHASDGGWAEDSGFETTSSAVQGVRFYAAGGTFTSGIFRLYGLTK